MPRFFPAELLDGLGGRRADAGRLGADDDVFAVGFVPDGRDFDTLLGGHDDGLQLGRGLMGKAVAHAEREFSQCGGIFHGQRLNAAGTVTTQK